MTESTTSAGLLANEIERIGDVIHDIADRSEDEGDRVYFGSTNDPHALVRQARYLHKVVERLRQSAAPASEAGEVDSGFDGASVERAELAWANLPTTRNWTSLSTAEKALACHTFARLSRPSESAEAVEMPQGLGIGLQQVRYVLRSVANGDDQSAVAGKAAEIVQTAIEALAKLEQGGAK